MKNLFIDCPTGLAGDMLLAAFLDLGVPKEVIDIPLSTMGLRQSYSIKVKETKSYGLRGLRAVVENTELDSPFRCWKDIKEMINQASWSYSLKKRVYEVFNTLAEAESKVHGHSIEEVHFHELGAIDALVDIVGVCSAVEHLSPERIICNFPPAGHGRVNTSHGLLPLPVPAVLEIARKYQISLVGGEDISEGELTTPTGIALMAVLANTFGKPSFWDVQSVGIGIGTRDLNCPNILRICDLNSPISDQISSSSELIKPQEIIIQEAWIDDATAEDLAFLVTSLRAKGAIDVATSQVIMKKGRQGVNISALVRPEKAERLRLAWYLNSTTLGVRERSEQRWVLKRRNGFCITSYGKVRFKQVQMPDGKLLLKPEHDDLVKISSETGNFLGEVRGEVILSSKTFVPEEEWYW